MPPAPSLTTDINRNSGSRRPTTTRTWPRSGRTGRGSSGPCGASRPCGPPGCWGLGGGGCDGGKGDKRSNAKERNMLIFPCIVCSFFFFLFLFALFFVLAVVIPLCFIVRPVGGPPRDLSYPLFAPQNPPNRVNAFHRYISLAASLSSSGHVKDTPHNRCPAAPSTQGARVCLDSSRTILLFKRRFSPSLLTQTHKLKHIGCRAPLCPPTIRNNQGRPSLKSNKTHTYN